MAGRTHFLVNLEAALELGMVEFAQRSVGCEGHMLVFLEELFGNRLFDRFTRHQCADEKRRHKTQAAQKGNNTDHGL